MPAQPVPDSVTPKRVKLGVVGLGFMGMTHVKALKHIPNAQLAAVVSSDPKKLSGDLRDVGGNLGIEGELFDFSNVAKLTDWRELLASDVDAIDICGPTNVHEEIAIAAMRAGKHVLLEKPMALSAAGCDRILAAQKETGMTLMVGHVLRFFPMYRSLATGQFGPPKSAFFRRRCAAPNWSKWLLSEDKSGGAVVDLLIHDIDLCLYLFGMPEAISATGVSQLANGIDVVTAQLHYVDVPSVTVTGGWHHPASYPFSMEYTLVFEKATFEFSSAGRPVTRYNVDGSSTPVTLADEDGYVEEIRYFVDCVANGTAPDRCPPRESAAAVKIALQIADARDKKGEKIPCQL